MPQAFSRRNFNALGLAAVGTAVAGIRGAQAATSLRVGKAVSESIAFAPADIGMKRGLFQKLGLELEITGFAGGAKMHQALAAGSLDIALGSGPDLPFIIRGEPARAVATIVDAPAYLVVLAGNDPAISSIAELRGKTVNVASLSSLTGWLGSQIWQRQGWAHGDLKFTTSPPTAGLALLKTNQISAMVTDGTFALKAEEQKQGRIIFNFGTMVPDFHTHMVFASDALIASNPDAIRAFLTGWYETIAAMNADRARTVQDLAEVLGLDQTVAGRSYDLFMPIFKSNGRFSDKALAVLSRSFVEMGTLPSEPADMHRLYTEAFLPKS